MEVLISAVASDLVSRFLSFLAEKIVAHTCEEDDRRRLERVLLRMNTVVDEAEGRDITNRGMLLQLKTLSEGVYLGYYMLDRLKVQSLGQESFEGDEVSHQNHSFTDCTFNTAKRLRFASIFKNTPVASGTGSTIKLKSVLESLEAKIADMREFVILLGSCPRLVRQPSSTYIYMDKCMFGRHIEKEQLINFLLCDDSHDCINISILPVIGPHIIGKTTLVRHACKDERVQDRFSHMFFFKGDDLQNGEFAVMCKAASGKCLFVVDFSLYVDEAGWTNFQSYLQKLPGIVYKIVVIGRAEKIAELGTTQPIRMKFLSQEEYWYYFKSIAFGSMDPDEHPKLASLGMQLATGLYGSFIAANIIGGVLRANPNAKFWYNILLRVREAAPKHRSFSGHTKDILERHSPKFTKFSSVGGQVQGYLVYGLREAIPGQSELPKLSWQELLSGVEAPDEDKFDVVAWRSRIPPYSDYIISFEKQKPRRKAGRMKHLARRKHQHTC
ncbi:hypothetical protein QYE76_064849 [Lolium multiflorum]|uniref:Disease resistance N-terminal domain-containing protein n=1 Tax=Lolium multiflorum TaxID=4521 RepID=A0AAD8WAC8_LOLMU|nr:hypothetical protein QYE76_064849 [Lolium multiflorum]